MQREENTQIRPTRKLGFVENESRNDNQQLVYMYVNLHGYRYIFDC